MTSSEGRAHTAFEMMGDELGAKLDCHIVDSVSHPGPGAGRLALARYQLANWKAFRKGLRGLRASSIPNAIYVVNLDYCHFPLAILGSPFGSIPFAGMLMGVRFHLTRLGLSNRSRMWGATQDVVFRRLLSLSELRAVMTVDPALRLYARQVSDGSYDKVRYVPDPPLPIPTFEREKARALLTVPGDAMVVLVFGRLTARKAIDSLLRAMAMGRLDESLHVILAGEQDSSVEELLESRFAAELRGCGRVRVLNRFIRDDEAGLVFSAADAAWLAYRNFEGMSGVLVQAARHGLPIIGSKTGVVGWLTAGRDLGPVVDPESLNSITSALSKLCREKETRERWAANARRLGREHSPEQFGQAICDAVAGLGAGVASSTPSVR